MTKPLTILVVEDDIALNEAYQMILASAGHTVRTAENGEQALRVITEEGEPDLIFLDLRMPVMNGIEFLRAYQPTSHPNTTVIVFSNYDADNEVKEAYNLGIDRYILKARATPKELLKVVDSVRKQ
jgi:CheY-like chemotaxis protein